MTNVLLRIRGYNMHNKTNGIISDHNTASLLFLFDVKRVATSTGPTIKAICVEKELNLTSCGWISANKNPRIDKIAVINRAFRILSL